ncbi:MULTISPECIES: rhamnulokinase [unclassified Clostridioides]|uniref:rhamnulokinase n=1 Tax=unclassified Clostridioides TaxID=2635829 RepID=UPI001D0F4E8E|nr:rhamnulokinase [Clostridioides sp. ES-S-0171-01]MCC0688329.1 rhamnulokinase [Clostridioides sp. ES-S-0056-01]MCC0715620.1 rhamnulokinase [Clostridioides sp. ES-S-0077-01]UDN54424.1 rhamnulokinase [Clostridioides sp. ES-S-0054-01]
MRYYLAIDIGASSGRHIISCINKGKLEIEEVYRFENNLIEKDGYFCWDISRLFFEIKNGIKKCIEIDKIPVSMAIDTWAVDFVLLDEKDTVVGNCVSYRDKRTDGMMEEVFKIVDKNELYLKTGIQFQKFNSIYQLLAIKKQQPELLKRAKSFLMIPDYFNFLLTGKKVAEYTNATTTQLVNATTNNWDEEIITRLGFNKKLFSKITPPKTILGSLKKELVEELGYDLEVILPATHDTGSAFIAIPAKDRSILLSSGTWSLLGVELEKPECKLEALKYNFTNEGGYEYRYRFLKNIMGLWMIQEARRCYKNKHSFEELVEYARLSKGFKSVVDVNDDRFLKPENMVQEIKKYCIETNQTEPQTVGEVAYCIFNSLAKSYNKSINEIEEITGEKLETVSVFGGGCQNELLNELISKGSGKKVLAGPVEATALGNIVCQLIAKNELKNLEQARDIIGNSFDIIQYN